VWLLSTSRPPPQSVRSLTHSPTKQWDALRACRGVLGKNWHNRLLPSSNSLEGVLGERGGVVYQGTRGRQWGGRRTVPVQQLRRSRRRDSSGGGSGSKCSSGASIKCA
jgi:hypothetical protein